MSPLSRSNKQTARLIVNGTAGNVLRLLPPLNLSRSDADAGLAIIERALKEAPIPKVAGK